MKSIIVTMTLAAITGYSFAGESGTDLGAAFNQLKDLTLIGVAEREQVCSKSIKELDCRTAFTSLINSTFEAESKVFEALTAEQAGDITQRDRVIAEMQKAALDGRAELERLKSLHVP